MSDREPYDFSSLAPDFSQLEEAEAEVSIGPLGAGMRPLFDVTETDDFEAEMERLASEEQGLSVDHGEIDAQFRVLQRALADLGENLSDPDLDAEEAWLESLVEDPSDLRDD